LFGRRLALRTRRICKFMEVTLADLAGSSLSKEPSPRKHPPHIAQSSGESRCGAQRRVYSLTSKHETIWSSLKLVRENWGFEKVIQSKVGMVAKERGYINQFKEGYRREKKVLGGGKTWTPKVCGGSRVCSVFSLGGGETNAQIGQ